MYGQTEFVIRQRHTTRILLYIQEHIIGKVSEIERLTGDLREAQREIAHAVSEDENARVAQNQLVARARYLAS